MDTREREAWIELALTPYIGAESFLRLWQHFGSAAAVLGADPQALKPHLYFQAALKHWRGDAARQAAEAALNWEASHADGRLLLLADADYPEMLAEGMAPPPLLFVRGDAASLRRPALAIVGSRHATPQALRIARDFGQALSDAGVVVVSGMADGIDTAAHEGALRGRGATVAVWGTGIDRVYPAKNKALAQQITGQGCVVSEFPLDTRPVAGNFPRRNRIIAALSQATLVVEAAPESGSLITARLAAEMGREVLAVPGSIDNPHSKGCHALIKQGAKLTENLDDIWQECPGLMAASLQHSFGRSPLQNAPLQPSGLPESLPSAAATQEIAGNIASQHGMLAQMGFDPVHPDALAQTLGIAAADVYAELTELELAGSIAALPGGRYQRVQS